MANSGNQSEKRPVGVSAVGLFLCFGASMATLAGLTLAFPGTVLDRAWAINSRGHAGLAPFAPAIGYAFFLLAALLVLAAFGWFKRRRWGWLLTIFIIATQVGGDLVNAFRGDLLRGLTGFVIAGVLLVYLLMPSVRGYFR